MSSAKGRSFRWVLPVKCLVATYDYLPLDSDNK